MPLNDKSFIISSPISKIVNSGSNLHRILHKFPFGFPCKFPHRFLCRDFSTRAVFSDHELNSPPPCYHFIEKNYTKKFPQIILKKLLFFNKMIKWKG